MAGRPSSFKPEFIEQARKLCELGATDEEVAAFFDVSTRTIYRWQSANEGFCQSLKAGKVAADERVERSLYHRAVGYTFDSEKVFQFQGQIVRTPTKEHVPPDTTAAIFWLKNRKPSEWRDVRTLEGTVNHQLAGVSDDELAAIAFGGGERAAETKGRAH
jgi:hypothetical protein